MRAAERAPAGRRSPRSPSCFGAAAATPSGRAATRAAADGRADADRGRQAHERAVPDRRARSSCRGLRVRRRRGGATATVALIGDSHARTGARRSRPSRAERRWHGLSHEPHGCPLSKAVRNMPEPSRSHCTGWPGGVRSGSSATPRSTRSSSPQLTGGAGVVAARTRAAQSRGYLRRVARATAHRRAHRRDPRHAEGPRETDACVEQAIGAQAARRAGLRGAARGALDPTPRRGRRAARSERGADASTSRASSATAPVLPRVGGALVYKDNTHITTVFAATLGPFLQQAAERTVRTSG